MTLTTAQEISEFFDNDGQCFEMDEASLVTVCQKHAVRVDRRDTSSTVDGSQRYIFADDSAITVHEDAWDLGFTDCWCWESAPDLDNCPIHKR